MTRPENMIYDLRKLIKDTACEDMDYEEMRNQAAYLIGDIIKKEREHTDRDF